jgi:peptidoglycan/LPS O-acetylase OafA/YrhL
MVRRKPPSRPRRETHAPDTHNATRPASWAARAWHFSRSALYARQPDHRAPLDGLRAIAALLIVLFHCAVWLPLKPAFRELPPGVLSLFRQCWIGVDLFFVLSGFLIGQILWLQLRQGGVNFKAFYIRRIFRTFPLYYVVLTASVFLFSRADLWRVLYSGQPWAATLAGSWANYLYVSNYTYGMFVPNALSWGWSLCIEEHFYLVFPAALAMLFRQARGWVRPLVLATLALVPLLCRAIAYVRGPDSAVFNWLYPGSHTHSDGLVVGVLIAYAYVFHLRGCTTWVTRLGPLTWIMGLACLGAVFRWGGLFQPGVFPTVLQFFVLAIGTGLLLLNGLFLGNWVSRFLGSPRWVPLARLSYSLYLVHLFVVIGVLGRWPIYSRNATAAIIAAVVFTAVVLLLSFAASALLFLAVERPMLTLGARLSRRHSPPAAAARP